MIKDASNREIDVGDTVEIVSLPDRLLDGLPEAECAFFCDFGWQACVVDEFVEEDSVMVGLRDDASGIIHFLLVYGRNLKRRNCLVRR